MAYEPRAATSSHTADTFSPRHRASTPQPIAPATATPVQTMTDLTLTLARSAGGVIMEILRDQGWAGLPASRAARRDGVVGDGGGPASAGADQCRCDRGGT